MEWRPDATKDNVPKGYKYVGKEYMGLEIVRYEPTEYQSSFGVKPSGPTIEIKYKGANGEYQWIQTIETNSPGEGRGNTEYQYVDTDRNDGKPFYYGDNSPYIKGADGYNTLFYDSPLRYDSDADWNAELSLVRKGTYDVSAMDGDIYTKTEYNPVVSLSYGFYRKDNNNTTLKPIKILKFPSLYHQKAINSATKMYPKLGGN